MREAHPTIEALSSSVIGVGTGAHHQAERLMATEYPFTLLVDPDKNLYRAVGVERIRLNQWLRPSTWRRYLRSRGQARQGAITGDPLQAPGVVIVDTDGIVRYLHRGITLADYPTIDEVVSALEEIAGQ